MILSTYNAGRNVEGKIVVYSSETGLGKIITPQKKKFNFTVDDWDDYDTMPTVGLPIRFTPDTIHARHVTPAEGESASADSRPAENPQDTKERTTPPATATDEETPTEEAHEPEVDIETTIQLHFDDILKKIDADRALLNETRRLDFLKMRRFLETAYNNLTEIDHRFENVSLTEIRRQLTDAYEIYRQFKKRTTYLSKAYEQVFLNRQRRYKELRAKIEINKNRIAALTDTISRHENDVKEKGERLKKLKPQSDEALYLTNEIKILKRALVDAIHEVGKLTEENRLYAELLDSFYKAHYDRFKKLFTEFVETHEALLRKAMDVLAYRFDAMMWEMANRSEAIQRFFFEAGITDEFSSITYLKYYIKTLDTSKLNEENRQLLDLLKYLEAKSRYRILCLDDDNDFLSLIRQVIHEIDRDISVILAARPEQAAIDLKSGRFDIVIVNPEIRGMDVDHLLRMIKERLPEAEVAFFAKKINRTLLLKAKQHNIAAIIPKTLSKEELHDQFVQYLK